MEGFDHEKITNETLENLKQYKGSAIILIHACFRELRPNEEGNAEIGFKNHILSQMIVKIIEESTCDLLKEVTAYEWIYLIKCITCVKTNIKID